MEQAIFPSAKQRWYLKCSLVEQNDTPHLLPVPRASTTGGRGPGNQSRRTMPNKLARARWQGTKAVPDGVQSVFPRARLQRHSRKEKFRTPRCSGYLPISIKSILKILTARPRLEILYFLPSSSSLGAWLKIKFEVTSEVNP